MSAIFLPLWNCFIFHIEEHHLFYNTGKFYVHIFSHIEVMYNYHLKGQGSGSRLRPENQ